jgi:shikimate dehydrogenase
MHNAAYAAKSLNYAYLAFDVEEIGRALGAMKTLGIVGYSVSLPHKVAVLEYLDEVDPVAAKIGAVNTVVNRAGSLIGYNTDWEGCMKALKELTEIEGKNVVLLGAGGAGRAIAFGVRREGASFLSIVDVHIDKAQSLARDTDAAAYHLIDLPKLIADADILIHATPVGMNSEESIVPVEALRPGLVVHDIVYTPFETTLVKQARERGCSVVLGYKMLLYQGVRQFELFTGEEAPVQVMEKALLQYLGQ